MADTAPQPPSVDPHREFVRARLGAGADPGQVVTELLAEGLDRRQAGELVRTTLLDRSDELERIEARRWVREGGLALLVAVGLSAWLFRIHGFALAAWAVSGVVAGAAAHLFRGLARLRRWGPGASRHGIARPPVPPRSSVRD